MLTGWCLTIYVSMHSLTVLFRYRNCTVLIQLRAVPIRRCGRVTVTGVVYSERRLLTGLALAARIVCKLRVSRAMSSIINPLSAYTHQLIVVR